MAAMVVIYLLIALPNLGSFKVPATVWQPLRKGESLVLDLGREVPVSRIYYYCGINDKRFQQTSFSLDYETKGRFRPLAHFEKNDCNIWKFQDAGVTTSRLRIVADTAGGALNELVVLEKGAQVPLAGMRISALNSAGTEPQHLLDEQSTFEAGPSFINGFYFDEVYHGRTAYEHLQRMEPYENTHPPLGKLFIASGIAVFGMNSFGWRIAGTLFGAALLPVMYLFGRKLFGRSFFAFCAAFLMMVDFMHFTQSRIALIDIFGVFFITAMYYFIHDFYVNSCPMAPIKKSAVPLILGGVCFGLGAASKWIAIYAGAGLALLVALQLFRSFRNYRGELGTHRFFWCYLLPVICVCLFSFLVIPAIIYLLSYLPYLMVEGETHGFMDILRNQLDMFDYHSGLKATHPFSSPWWSWPLDLQPVWFYTASGLLPGRTSTIASFGNPAIWWTGLPAVIAAVIIAARKRERRMAVIFTAFAFQYLPWMFVTRLTFIYHFFSAVPFMILCQVYVIQQAMERWPKARWAVSGYLTVAGLLFIIFYPALSGMEVSTDYIDRLRWLKSWIF